MVDRCWYIGKRLALSIVVFAAVYLTVRLTWAPEYFRVVGCSMWPNMSNGDHCIAIKNFGKIERGDVVDFRRAQINLVKRVIGIPGDDILITKGSVFINGIPEFTSDIIIDKTITQVETFEVLLLSDQYFMLGDNRIVSYDSRYFGPVNRNDIMSKLIFACKQFNPTRYMGEKISE